MTPPAPEPPDEPPVRTTSLAMRRYVYRPLGFVALGLGIVGVVTPVMPGTVFLILAAWLFARSSPEVERWILTHPRYGPTVRDWRAHGVIPRKVKLIAFASFGVSLVVEWALSAPPIAIGSTAAALLAVGGWMATRPESQ